MALGVRSELCSALRVDTASEMVGKCSIIYCKRLDFQTKTMTGIKWCSTRSQAHMAIFPTLFDRRLLFPHSTIPTILHT